MHVKDKQLLANVFHRISVSVTLVNEKILAHQKGRVKTEDLVAVAALEQLAMQHEILILLATLIYEQEAGDVSPLPELPKKIIGFN